MGVVIGAELNAALAETPTPTHEDVVAAVHEEKADAAQEVAEQVAIEQVDQGKIEEREAEEDRSDQEKV
jgi:type II secretory pathway component PulC